MPKAWTALLIALVLSLSLSADAQPGGSTDAPYAADPATDNVTEPADLQSTDQAVKLNEQADDPRIADRLREIYTSSGWFKSLSVKARDGIVYIDGTTSSDEYRDWAGQLARRTEGVVAVVNRIEVDAPPAIDAFSLKRELIVLWDEFLRLLPLIGIGLLAVILCLVIARYLGRLLVIPVTRVTDSKLLQNLSRKLVAVLVVLLGVIFFLRITGLTGVAVTLVSGTGILGLILGFAFRDIAENFLASVLMSVQTPFQLGDVIEVVGHTGVVHKVTARGTILVDFDGNHIQLANATVYKSTLKNLTANPNMRLHFVVGIGYDASITAMQETALAVLHEHKAVLDDPEPLVLVDQLGPATINMKVYFWIDIHQYSMLKVKSAVMRQVLREIEKAGISLPDESREIIFPQGVPVAMQPIDGQAESDAAPHDSSPGHAPALPLAEPVQARKKEVVDADLLDDATEAEGDLTSEVDDIKAQAANSREVEEGQDILGQNKTP